MAIRDELKARIDQKKDTYIEAAKRIHGYSEIGNEEVQSAAELVTLLKDASFDVETSIAGHETGFIGKKSSSKPGRNIVFLAEYDALPGLGHACGHNIIGTTSVAAAIALADDLEQTGGTVYVYGTPAEEGGPNGSAKASFVKAGLFDEIDAALMIHPSRETGTTGATLAVDPLEFHFTGRAAHAAGSPEEGINALDGVLQLFSGINALRQQLASTIRIHGIITHGGDAPNIIPDYAAARFFIRATTWEEVVKTSEKVQQIARGAALQTGAEVDIKRFQNEIHEFVRNRQKATV
ncbi:M20 family metallopeptidase [Paenalkalicoccus suaedae]|uniref:M20 family metallopeptidase n=1 Tax=Paenalkalicoccus suaedae TaxID=2592382 RepID=A0A859FA03_9BACI|nr:M20 family metallopeptidase [Paenalkalicoccus suaedae]